MQRFFLVLGAFVCALAVTAVSPAGPRTKTAQAVPPNPCDEPVLSTIAGAWHGTATDSLFGSENVTLNVTRTQNRRFEIVATATAGGRTLTATSDATISDSCVLDANGSGPFISQFHIHGSVQPSVGESPALLFGSYEVKYVNGTNSNGNISMRKAGGEQG
jgi:hypothetical protein